MSKQAGLAERNTISTDRKPAVVVIIALCVSIALILKSSDFSIIAVSILTRILQYFEVNAHIDAALVLRYQEELIQNLSTQMLAKGEWVTFEIRPRPLPLGLRIKYVLMAAAFDVSAIIPTWNEEKYLARCLGSLRKQRPKQPVEIIVVDGGSTDRTVAVAEKYAHKILVEPGTAVGAARNMGAKEAQGDILAFVDADTMACESWLEEITHTFIRNPAAVGVTGPTLPYEGAQLDHLVYHIATGWAQRFSLKLGLPHVAGFNCAYRKRPFWDAGGFDENRELSEDVMLSLRIRHEGKVVFNPEMVAYTSLRRIKKYGYPYLTTYYVINASAMLLFNKTLGYPKVR